MDLNSKIYIAGHKGMVGSAILQELKKKGYSNFITSTSKELDLRNQSDTNRFIREKNPDIIIMQQLESGVYWQIANIRGNFYMIT